MPGRPAPIQPSSAGPRRARISRFGPRHDRAPPQRRDHRDADDGHDDCQRHSNGYVHQVRRAQAACRLRLPVGADEQSRSTVPLLPSSKPAPCRARPRSMSRTIESSFGHHGPRPEVRQDRSRVVTAVGHGDPGRGRSARTPRYQCRRSARLVGTDDDVVVGQLDQARSPTADGLAHGDLELTGRPLAVEPCGPRVDDPRVEGRRRARSTGSACAGPLPTPPLPARAQLRRGRPGSNGRWPLPPSGRPAPVGRRPGPRPSSPGVAPHHLARAATGAGRGGAGLCRAQPPSPAATTVDS